MGANPLRLTRPAPPVALLVSRSTASSGEAVVVSFLGRDRTRTFGLPTAGFSTANQTFGLPDGALLVVTTAVMADRTGRRHGGAIAPDVVTPARSGQDVAAAKAWLTGQPGCA
jgi:C-terminal processing protease CtpA/Prc